MSNIQPTNIPDDVRVLRGIVEVHIKPDGTISSAAFKDTNASVNREDMMSVEDTLKRGTVNSPFVAVGALITGNVRSIETMKVIHTPSRRNSAHSEIQGKKTTAIARKLSGMATVYPQQ